MRARTGRRPALRVLVTALALVVGIVSCSDAHTEEEKAWADTGIDPETTFVLAPQRLQNTVRALLDTYKDTNQVSGPLLLATVEDEDAVDRIEEIDAPVVWFGPETAVASLEADAETLLGLDPLAAVGRTGELTELPSLEVLAGDTDETTGHCLAPAPCTATTEAMFAAAGIVAVPTTKGPPAPVLDEVWLENIDIALVPRSYSAPWFPRLANFPLPEGQDGALPHVVAGFGGGEVPGEVVAWVEAGIELLAPVIQTTSGIRQPPSP